MASGTLGTPASMLAATYTTIYTVPTGKVATVNLNLVNTNYAAVLVRVAITSSGTPGANDWVEYDAYLKAAGDLTNSNVLERTAFMLEAGKSIVCYSNTAGVTARAYGAEG
jgi:hypothetical protein